MTGTNGADLEGDLARIAKSAYLKASKKTNKTELARWIEVTRAVKQELEHRALLETVMPDSRDLARLEHLPGK